MARTDVHSTSNFIAPHYEFIEQFGVCSFSDGNGNIEREGYGYEIFDGPIVTPNLGGEYASNNEKCDICGADYVHGAVWLHTPSQKYITIGQTCSANVGLVVKGDLRKGVQRRLRRRAQERTWRRQGSVNMRKFLAEYPQLRKDLTMSHRILREMSRAIIRWGYISAKQIAFAHKLAEEIRHPADIVAAVSVPANLLDGRVMIEGTVLNVKEKFNEFTGGFDLKMTVGVPCEGGQFKLWGTCPQALLDAEGTIAGRRVSFMARIEVSDRDPAFGFIKRPSKAKFLEV